MYSDLLVDINVFFKMVLKTAVSYLYDRVVAVFRAVTFLNEAMRQI